MTKCQTCLDLVVVEFKRLAVPLCLRDCVVGAVLRSLLCARQRAHRVLACCPAYAQDCGVVGRHSHQVWARISLGSSASRSSVGELLRLECCGPAHRSTWPGSEDCRAIIAFVTSNQRPCVAARCDPATGRLNEALRASHLESPRMVKSDPDFSGTPLRHAPHSRSRCLLATINRLQKLDVLDTVVSVYSKVTRLLEACM